MERLFSRPIRSCPVSFVCRLVWQNMICHLLFLVFFCYIRNRHRAAKKDAAPKNTSFPPSASTARVYPQPRGWLATRKIQHLKLCLQPVLFCQSIPPRKTQAHIIALPTSLRALNLSSRLVAGISFVLVIFAMTFATADARVARSQSLATTNSLLRC